MVSRRAGGLWAELAWPRLAGLVCHEPQSRACFNRGACAPGPGLAAAGLVTFLPLTFIFSAFVPTQGMPGWL